MLKHKHQFLSLFGRWLALLLVILGANTGVMAESLTIGYFEVAPHVIHQADGSPAGPAVELFKAVATTMGVTDVRFQKLPLARLLLQLKSGDTDMAIFISKTPEREVDYYYPSKPYYVAKPGLAVMASSSLTQVKSAHDIQSLKIGIMGNSVTPNSMSQPGLDLYPLYGDDLYKRSIQMLTMGRMDAMYSPDSEVLRSVARSQGLQDKIRVIDLPDPANGVYYAFSHNASKKFAARYAKAMEFIFNERGNYTQAFLR